jgi:tetratricopeptide (TPR) repeat protein
MYLQKGEFAKAEADYTTAIGIDPKLVVLYANRSNVRSSLKQYDGAIDDATKALALMPKNVGPATRAIGLGNRAVGYGGKKLYDLALADLDEAIKLAPRAGFYQARAYGLSQVGRYDLALKDAEELLRLDANDASAWNLKCWYRALLGQLDEALADCDKSLSIQPTNANTLDSRAFIRLKLKQFDKALEDYNQALKQLGYSDGGPVGSIHASALYGRGLTRMRSGDALGGATDMAAAKAAKPEVVDDYKKYGA